MTHTPDSTSPHRPIPRADTASETRPGGPADSGERTDLLETLQSHRAFLRHTLVGLNEQQARTAATVSALTVGGLVKHVAATESEWARWVREGPGPAVDWNNVDWGNPPAEVLEMQAEFVMAEGETVEGVLATYAEVAARTDALVAEVDLDRTWPLPDAPWFEAGAVRTARRTFLHIVAETAQHAGHADIVREAIDGQRTMSGS